MSTVSQRGRDAIKTALDRRYALNEDIEVARTGLSETTERLASLEALVTVQREAIAAELKTLIDDQTETIEAGLSHLRDTVLMVRNAVDELAETTRPAVDFVAQEPPHELRKRLFEAHRLARECAVAIELMLQEEVLIKRDIDIALDVPARRGKVSTRS